MAIGPDSTLENLQKIATSVFYNRNQEEAEERKAKGKEKTADLVVSAPRGCQKSGTRGTQVSHSYLLQLWLARACPERLPAGKQQATPLALCYLQREPLEGGLSKGAQAAMG